ncbi:hypothetical protein NQZ68_002888 [Dissostichus eleginoides]|nr:hypothetical protein NQZ68_002888 [Dissostichus eleginoides]
MGFELPEEGSGPGQRLVCTYWGGPGTSVCCDVKCESEQGVTAAASGKSVPTGGECHIQINESRQGENYSGLIYETQGKAKGRGPRLA